MCLAGQRGRFSRCAAPGLRAQGMHVASFPELWTAELELVIPDTNPTLYASTPDSNSHGMHPNNQRPPFRCMLWLIR